MQTFLTALLQCSVSMSLVTLVYAAILPFLSKRYAAKWCYIVWLVIAAGWIFPCRPEIVLPFLPEQVSTAPLIPVQFVPTQPITTNNPAQIVTATGEMAASSTAPSLWTIAAIIWIAGVIFTVAYHALRYRRFMKIVSRWSEPITEPEILKMLDALKKEQSIKAQVKLMCSSVTSPMLVGFVRPIILIPPVQLSQDELAFILRHELIHFKRHDLCYKALILMATIIHWFNPVVYLMAKAIALQCEISCDVLVLVGADFQQRKQYGETIIGVVRNGSKLQTVLSTNFYGGKKSMKNRLSSIMDTTKKKAGFVILCIILIAITGTGVTLATANKEPSDSDKQDVLSLVENFGETLKMVTLTAPKDIAADNIEEYYSEFVTPELLTLWMSNPQNAPGRTVSSPWPDRIEVTDIKSAGNGKYNISGEIIEVTSAKLQNGGAAAKYPVTLTVSKQHDRWLISSVMAGTDNNNLTLEDFKKAKKLDEIIGEPGWEDTKLFILAELPGEDIALYGMKDKNGIYENVAIRSGEKINYYGWSYYAGKFDAGMSYQDYDGDGAKELAVHLYFGGGTGVSIDQLFMLEELRPGIFEPIQFKSNDYIAQVENIVSYRVNEESKTISLFNEETELQSVDISWLKENEKVKNVYYGNIVRFDLSHGIVMGITPGMQINDWFSLQYDGFSELEATVEYQSDGTFHITNLR
jgi:beta-lactamase regulating signal transducer with metallopeptidase domain